VKCKNKTASKAGNVARRSHAKSTTTSLWQRVMVTTAAAAVVMAAVADCVQETSVSQPVRLYTDYCQ